MIPFISGLFENLLGTSVMWFEFFGIDVYVTCDFLAWCFVDVFAILVIWLFVRIASLPFKAIDSAFRRVRK